MICCVTQPDKPRGRKRILSPTPIGKWAEDTGIAIYKPKSINQLSFQENLRSLKLDIILVFSFGQILNEQILAIPKFSCVNIHTSLLPKYRGASPICAAILAGEKYTGISIMKMEKGLDSGPIYHQFEHRIEENIDTPELESQLALLTAEHICTSLAEIVYNNLKPEEQNPDSISYAKKIKKEDGNINWSNDARQIERHIRGYHPWPGAWFNLRINETKTRKIIITAASARESCPDNSGSPGTIIKADKLGWEIACGNNVLSIETVIPEGKREMTATEFLIGNPLTIERQI